MTTITTATATPASDKARRTVNKLMDSDPALSERILRWLEPAQGDTVTSAEEAVAVFRPRLAGLDVERTCVAYLDRRFRVLGVEYVAQGTDTQTQADPRIILRRALLNGATAIVLAHNHPPETEEPEPSDADIQTTARLASACSVVGIELLDHVLLNGSGERWVSIRRHTEQHAPRNPLGRLVHFVINHGDD